MPTTAHEPKLRKVKGKHKPWSAKEIPHIQQALASWFAQHARPAPWRETQDPYAILVSEVMLQQTRVETVLQGGWYVRWMKSFPHAHALAGASEEAVLSHWQGLGYYNRARNLKRAAQVVSSEQEGIWPKTAEALRQLPGIGDYTAAAVASIAYGESVAAIDANVVRILARVGDYAEAIHQSKAKAWFAQKASLWIPQNQDKHHPGTHNAALMELGQQICTPRKPKCAICPLRSHCQTQQAEALPKRPPKAKTIQLEEHALFAIRNKEQGSSKEVELLLAQEQGSRRKGFWHLPLRDKVQLAQECSVQALQNPLIKTHYHITKHRVSYQVHQAKPSLKTEENEVWQTISSLETLPITAPSRRAIEQILNGKEN